MAVGGIFLTVFSLVLLQWTRDVFNSTLSDVELGAEFLNIDLDNLNFELGILASNATKPEELKELVGVKTREDALRLVFDYQAKIVNLKRTSTDVAQKMDSVKYLSAQTTSKMKVYYFGIGLGLFTTIFGFLLWYFKLQRYQDTLWKKGKYLA